MAEVPPYAMVSDGSSGGILRGLRAFYEGDGGR